LEVNSVQGYLENNVRAACFKKIIE